MSSQCEETFSRLRNLENHFEVQLGCGKILFDSKILLTYTVAFNLIWVMKTGTRVGPFLFFLEREREEKKYVLTMASYTRKLPVLAPYLPP